MPDQLNSAATGFLPADDTHRHAHLDVGHLAILDGPMHPGPSQPPDRGAISPHERSKPTGSAASTGQHRRAQLDFFAIILF